MSKIVEQQCGTTSYYIVIDKDGYPIAQGSKKLCEEVMDGKHGRPRSSTIGSCNKKLLDK